MQILCFAEVKDIPTQYWFHVLISQDKENTNKEIIESIKAMVRPGSILLFDIECKIDYYSQLKCLSDYKIYSTEQLSRHNRPECSILQILDTIWIPAVEICNEAQFYQVQNVQKFLYNQLWRRKFAKTPSSALEYFLHHIADHYSNFYLSQYITKDF